MVEAISLSAAQSQTLTAQRRTSAIRNEASQRLATGRRISKITDGAHDFLRARTLTNRAGALLEAKSGIAQGIDSLLAAQTGLQAVGQLGQQLKGLAILAQSAEGSDRTDLAKQFDTVRQQLDNLVGDVSYQGVNLLSNPPDTLRVSLGDQPGTTLNVAGQASDATGLGIGSASASYGNFATQANIDSAITALDSALSSLQSREFSIVGNAAILGVREDFTQNLADTLQSGADKLIAADLNTEGARLLSANVRDQLSVQGQRIAARSDQLVVELVQGR